MTSMVRLRRMLLSFALLGAAPLVLPAGLGVYACLHDGSIQLHGCGDAGCRPARDEPVRLAATSPRGGTCCGSMESAPREPGAQLRRQCPCCVKLTSFGCAPLAASPRAPALARPADISSAVLFPDHPFVPVAAVRVATFFGLPPPHRSTPLLI